MTKQPSHTTTQHDDHGSVSSYIVGFVLSLVLTLIPYYMVTREVGSGRTLLLIILGLGIIQMFVQIFFFLHLGRGPKPFYNIVFFAGTAGLITLVIGASLLIMNNLYHNMSPEEVTTRLAQEENIAQLGGRQTGACQGNNATHIVTITRFEVQPFMVDAKRCDTITFKSGDGNEYKLTFGPSEAPISYGGLYEMAIRSDRAKIVTLNEIGTFTFYDEMDRGITGQFSVEP